MYFIVYKPRTKYKLFSNEIWSTEREAKDYGTRNKLKVDWKVVEFNMINKNYGASHETFEVSAKRFDISPFISKYATAQTVYGISANRFYPLSTELLRSRS